MAEGRSRKAACQAAQPSILTLPDELLARIFGHLSFKDKVLCQLLSRKINNFLSCPGCDLIWGTIALAELPQLYETAQLARWLMKRRRGIAALTYSMPSFLKNLLFLGKEDPQCHAYRSKHFTYALQTVPVLAVALPVTALYLEEDVARRMLGTAPMAEEPSSQYCVTQYWASLESCLTDLNLHIPQNIEADADAIAALSQLTALQTLIITGLQQPEGSVRLSFPQLTSLYFAALDVPALVLDCPKLASLDMEEIHIDKISGLGASLQEMELRRCTDMAGAGSGGRGPVPSFSIGSLLGLQSLEISTDHSNPVRDRALFQDLSCLTRLTSLRLRDMPIESQSLPTALPTSLQHLQMEVSYGNNGIPVVIEALTNLQSLCLAIETHSGRLTRP